MPGNISEFIKDTLEDVNKPRNTFVMLNSKHDLAYYDAFVDRERQSLAKMKKAYKALYNSGNAHLKTETFLASNLARLSKGEDNEIVLEAFKKFSSITTELANLSQSLMANLNNNLVFPLDSLLKNELKSLKGDSKKNYEKAFKDLENKYVKLEKERRQNSKDIGFKSDLGGSPETKIELEKERRIFQLAMCEYLIKVNEAKTKKGVDLLFKLMEFYHAQNNYFQEGLKTMEHFSVYVDSLGDKLKDLRHSNDKEKRQLIDLRDDLSKCVNSFKEKQAKQSIVSTCFADATFSNKSSTNSNSVIVGSNLPRNSASGGGSNAMRIAYGIERSGYLQKKSGRGVTGRNRWQSRKCVIKDGYIFVYHADEQKDPARLHLLTCSVKTISDDVYNRNFDVTQSNPSGAKTFHFQAEDSGDREAWIGAISAAQNNLLVSMESGSNDVLKTSIRSQAKIIINEVQKQPSNNVCCDCGSNDSDWIVFNLGVFVCLQCVGIHRGLGTHISKTQSTVIDEMKPPELLIARVLCNRDFNEIMEATLNSSEKLRPISSMEERKTFIINKYKYKKYTVDVHSNEEDRLEDLLQGILTNDISCLLQVYAEGCDLHQPLPNTSDGENALHLAVSINNDSILPIVQFLIQNVGSQNTDSVSILTKRNENAAHISARYNHTECLKLLLTCRRDLALIENVDGKTPLDIAKENNFTDCCEILQQAINDGNFTMLEVINYDWELPSVCDYSDDDLDMTTPKRRSDGRPRPKSLINPLDISKSLQLQTQSTPTNQRSRTLTLNSEDSIKNVTPILTPKGTFFGKRKGYAAPPPPPGHSRNSSDFAMSPLIHSKHVRSPSDPTKMLNPPAEFSNGDKILATASINKFKPPTLPKPKQLDKNINGKSKSTDEDIIPVPSPRCSKESKLKSKKCIAIYDCKADNADELSFQENEIIVILEEEEEEWWLGYIENQPKRKGLFPKTYVQPFSHDF